jgi:RNA polymerase sigma-70 factor
MSREVLARLVQRARRQLPELGSVTASELESFISARVSVIDDNVRAEDLLIACACTKGVRAGHDLLAEMADHDIERAFGRIRPPFSLPRIHQIIWQHLLYVPDGGAPRIALYRGEVELTAYLRAIVNRLLLTLASQPKALATLATTEDAILEAKTNQVEDADLRRVKTNYLAGVRLVLTHTIASLDARDRALLRDAIVERHDLASLALMYASTPEGITAAVRNAREKLEYRFKNRLAERMRISDRDHATLVRFFGAQLESALVRIQGT